MVTSKFPPKVKKAGVKKAAASGKCKGCGMPKSKCKC